MGLFFVLIMVSLIAGSGRVNTALNMVASSSASTAGTTGRDSEWSPDSWKKCKVSQPPNFDEAELDVAVKKLEKCSPLVFAGEVRSLNENLAKACQGQGFLIMGGDCAEAFNEFNVDHVRDTFRVILQMSLQESMSE